mmetsp:Transcript_9961/g.27852  ORF Transcript_9961/g.27852 Transcript_9961/m.27852 type:complete len:84 (-) Transcript_9961:2-253(-)
MRRFPRGGMRQTPLLAWATSPVAEGTSCSCRLADHRRLKCVAGGVAGFLSGESPSQAVLFRIVPGGLSDQVCMCIQNSGDHRR